MQAHHTGDIPSSIPRSSTHDTSRPHPLRHRAVQYLPNPVLCRHARRAVLARCPRSLWIDGSVGVMVTGESGVSPGSLRVARMNSEHTPTPIAISRNPHIPVDVIPGLTKKTDMPVVGALMHPPGFPTAHSPPGALREATHSETKRSHPRTSPPRARNKYMER